MSEQTPRAVTVRLPVWALVLGAIGLIAALLGLAFLLGRNSGDPDQSSNSVDTVQPAVDQLRCNENAAQAATLNTEFADAIRAASRLQAVLNHYQASEPQFFSSYATDYQVSLVECADLTDDGVKEMVVGISAGASGRVFQWAIFAPDSDGSWMLAFDREGVDSTGLAVRANAVSARTPTYGKGDPLCCPSGFRQTTVAFRNREFRVTSATASPDERRIEVEDGRVTALGHLDPRVDTPVQAIGWLGTPTSISNYPDEVCTITWSDVGLAIAFADFGGGDPCGQEGRIASFTLTGKPAEQAGWQLPEGGTVGISSGRLAELFPGAGRHGAEWNLIEAPSPYGDSGTTAILIGYLVDGKALAFKFYVGAAGE